MISKLYQSTSLHALLESLNLRFCYNFLFALLHLYQFPFYDGNLCKTKFAIT